MANVLPFTLRTQGDDTVLCAHLARMNDQLGDLRQGVPALVVFQGPHGYVSPSWYPTKQEHGKVVPTWNYVIAQAHGTARVIDDPQWLMDQIGELTLAHEAERAEPWSVTDAPESFIQKLICGIVGLEIPVDRLEGKWKVSQNQPDQNRAGVEAGLRDDGNHALADLMLARATAG